MTFEYPFYGRVHELLVRSFKNDFILGEPLSESRREEGAFYLVFVHKALALLLLVDAWPGAERWGAVKTVTLILATLAMLIPDLFLLPKQRHAVAPNRRLDRIYGAIFATSYIGLIAGLLMRV